MAYATTAEMQTFGGQAPSDTARAQLALDIASGEVDDVLGFTLGDGATPTEAGDLVVRGTFETELNLPGPVVTEPTEVRVAGTAATFTRIGRVMHRPGGWGGPTCPVEILGLVHGYAVADVPPVLKGIVLGAAWRLYQATPGAAGEVQQETVGSYSMSRSQGPGTEGASSGLTAIDRERILRWRGSHAGSMSLGQPRWPVGVAA